jgi:hypothetical protein
MIDQKVSTIIKRKSRKLDRWTKDENEKLVEAVRLYGEDWDQVTSHVFTRSRKQVYDHHMRMKKRLKKESPSPSDFTDIDSTIIT